MNRFISQSSWAHFPDKVRQSEGWARLGTDAFVILSRQSCGQAAANCLGACALRAPFAFRDWVACHLETFVGRMISCWPQRQNIDQLEPWAGWAGLSLGSVGGEVGIGGTLSNVAEKVEKQMTLVYSGQVSPMVQETCPRFSTSELLTFQPPDRGLQ